MIKAQTNIIWSPVDILCLFWQLSVKEKNESSLRNCITKKHIFNPSQYKPQIALGNKSGKELEKMQTKIKVVIPKSTEKAELHIVVKKKAQ